MRRGGPPAGSPQHIAPAFPLIQSGKVRALAVTSARRSPTLPPAAPGVT